MKIGLGTVIGNGQIEFIESHVKNSLAVGYGEIVYLDESTDGTYEELLKHTNTHKHMHVLRSKEGDSLGLDRDTNPWQTVMNYCVELGCDWTVCYTINQILSAPAFKNNKDLLRERLQILYDLDIDLVTFPVVNLWRSKTWYRDDGSWYNNNSLSAYRTRGLSNKELSLNCFNIDSTAYSTKPINEMRTKVLPIVLLDYSTSSHELLEEKILSLMSLIQTFDEAKGLYLSPETVPHPNKWDKLNGYNMIHEFDIDLIKVDKSWFNEPIPDEPKPEIKSLVSCTKKCGPFRTDQYEYLHNEKFGGK